MLTKSHEIIWNELEEPRLVGKISIHIKSIRKYKNTLFKKINQSVFFKSPIKIKGIILHQEDITLPQKQILFICPLDEIRKIGGLMNYEKELTLWMNSPTSCFKIEKL